MVVRRGNYACINPLNQMLIAQTTQAHNRINEQLLGYAGTPGLSRRHLSDSLQSWPKT
jgi:hypothetical protein